MTRSIGVEATFGVAYWEGWAEKINKDMFKAELEKANPVRMKLFQIFRQICGVFRQIFIFERVN